MDVFQEVLQRSDILMVCDMLGLKLNRSHQCLCPFPNHNEDTPSFSISPQKQIFKCFGCGKAGNSIVLVAELYGVRNIEAAKIINRNLNLGIEFEEKGVKVKKSTEFNINKYQERKKLKEEFKKWTERSMRILCSYLDLLRKFENIEDFDNELFVEALTKKEYVEYLLDEYFIYGDEKDKVNFWKYKRKELNKIEERVRLFRTVS